MPVVLCKIFVALLYLANTSHAIIGGKEAPDHRYRYIVSLRRYNNAHFCGGSLIDKYHVLTAAHCIKEKTKYEVSVVAGSPYRKATNGDFYYVLNMAVHEDNYKQLKHPTITWHDIGLIRLTREVFISENVQLVALPSSDEPKEHDPVAVAGWGLVDGSGFQWVPRKLKELRQRISNIEHCKAMYPVWNNHICLYSVVGEGTCSGDSGGPIVIPAGGINGEDVLVGVASFVMPPCGHFPNFAVKVYNYLQWIADTKKKLVQVTMYPYGRDIKSG